MREPLTGDVIVTVTLNAGLLISYKAQDLRGDAVNAVSRPRYRATGRGIAAARVLHAFGHEVLTAGFAGGRSGDLIRADLA
ncbi:MAG TPA: 1-phosphofructokinase, partial [Streptosporangiaceae bacterium]|nr:1-phosphofructokinase [Streptosporangiaceae bacterium]